ncbi:MAG: hypothetical protein K5852_04410 [Eubacterium sp.]|nr:hypothetical protein [Eubacterium sp.]
MEYRATENKNKTDRMLQHKIIAICAAVILGVMAVGSLLLPDRSFSDEENRTLAQLPDLNRAALRNGSFFSDLSTYLQDQILGRDGWMRLKVAEEKAVGKQESGGVFLGKDGYLLEMPAEPDKEKLDRSAEWIRRFAEINPDLRMTMTLIPCAAAVFPELLPAGAPVRDQLADISYVKSRIGDAMPFIEMQIAFQNDQAGQIYYRTDHHWTSRGAYDAFQAIRWDMGIDQSAYFVPMTVTMDFEGTLASQSGSHSRRDSIQIYRLENEDFLYYTYYPDSQERIPSIYATEKLDEKDKYQVFFGGNHPVLTVRTTVDNGKSLLIFKDSYANSFVQFLLPYYERIVLVDPRYYYEDVGSLIKSEAITDVLFLYSMNTFATDSSLADVLEQAVTTAEETGGTAAMTEETGEPGAGDETDIVAEEAAGADRMAEETIDSETLTEGTDTPDAEIDSADAMMEETANAEEAGWTQDMGEGT